MEGGVLEYSGSRKQGYEVLEGSVRMRSDNVIRNMVRGKGM